MRVTFLIAVLVICGCTPDTSATPSLTFDHVWIHVTPGAPESEALRNAGFKLPPNGGRPHTGLGTASTAVIFHNAYLELIWVEEPHALKQESPDFAYTLLGGAGASPFGIGLRRATDRDELSFGSTPISAEFIEAGTSIEVAQWSDNSFAYPPIFVVPRYMGFPEWRNQVVDIRTNSLGAQNITQVRIYGPGLTSAPPAIEDLIVPEFVQFVSAENHLLELEFDERARNEVLDFRPTLPLVIRY